jgi:hypothetical protein
MANLWPFFKIKKPFINLPALVFLSPSGEISPKKKKKKKKSLADINKEK